MADKLNVLIDTDIGDDADDSLAIALAALSAEIKLTGITTVFKQTDKRAQLALKLLAATGCETISVYEGCGTPLAGGEKTPDPPCQWRPEFADGYTKNSLSADEYIIQALEEDASLIILALGPLTNLAAAELKAPGILRGRKIYMMGGAFDSAYPEWNFFCDPEAVEVVLKAGADITFFGLELTSRCKLEAADLQTITQSPLPVAQMLARMMTDWTGLTGYSDIFLHDLVPVCALLHPEWFQTVPRWVEIELVGEKTRGTAICDPNYYGNTDVKCNAKIAFMQNTQAVRDLFMRQVIQQTI